MKIVESSVVDITPSFEDYNSLDKIYKHIEKCGRVAYRSEDKITNDSAVVFVKMLEDKKHLSPLEHGTIYLTNESDFARYILNKYSEVVIKDKQYITTNLRCLIENNWDDDLCKICEPTKFHKKRISFYITCSRGISHQLVRHRVFSITQESQRYCNYSKGKFDEQISFIRPSWVRKTTFTTPNNIAITNDTLKPSVAEIIWVTSMDHAECDYMKLIKSGISPQYARGVLPNDCKTTLIMTGFKDDWVKFCKERTSVEAHPDMRKIALQIEELIKKYND